MDIEHTHIAAAGVVKALSVGAAIAASVAAGAGPSVHIAGAKGTAMAILNSGAGAGGTVTLDAALFESDDNATWTAVPSGAFTRVINAASLQTISFRPGERKAYITLQLTLGAGSTFPCSAELLYLP
jgi:hypothetical protein